jgi:hypothetical protein
LATYTVCVSPSDNYQQHISPSFFHSFFVVTSMAPLEELRTSELLVLSRLRALGLDTLVALPRLVVVGDTSSGKSSLLSVLSGIGFPSASTLSTRGSFVRTPMLCLRLLPRHQRLQSLAAIEAAQRTR